MLQHEPVLGRRDEDGRIACAQRSVEELGDFLDQELVVFVELDQVRARDAGTRNGISS